MTDRVMSTQLVIDREHEPDACVLTLYGELDLASSALLKDRLREAEAVGARRLVLDLGGLEFMDSTGLQVLLEANERSLENGHRLSLLRGPRAVHRIFELTHTTSVFLFDD